MSDSGGQMMLYFFKQTIVLIWCKVLTAGYSNEQIADGYPPPPPTLVLRMGFWVELQKWLGCFLDRSLSWISDGVLFSTNSCPDIA
jgi:hypothetical protein